jgi:hypothetical protein
VKNVEAIKQLLKPLFSDDTPENEQDEIRLYLMEDGNTNEKTRALAEIISEALRK